MPYRSESDALNAPIRILLITSRETKRWVIPKGNASSGMKAHSAAAAEAEEEAGVLGAICPTPLGSYRYRKRRGNGASLMVDVEVFPLAVSRELPNWKERAERERRWFSLAEAADAVEESDLRDLIRTFRSSEFQAAARRDTLLDTVVQKSGISSMFAWFQRLLPKQGNFFDLFEAHVKTVVAGADALARLLLHDHENRDDHIREVIERENDADEIIREILREVRLTFLTPFDRSAIISLTGSMDDSIDEMQAAVAAIQLYDVVAFEQEMKDMAAIIVDCTRVLAEAIPLLRDVGGNAARLHELTERLVRMEGHADDIHKAGLRAAFAKFGADPMGFIVRREIFNHLERIVDAIEDVANEINGLVIEHA